MKKTVYATTLTWGSGIRGSNIFTFLPHLNKKSIHIHVQ